ncbi:MAG: hypothetical protein ACI9JY_001913 [Saprospiraceae bacterium]|jgi:hypothetical protein
MKNYLLLLLIILTSTFSFAQSAEKSPFSTTTIPLFNPPSNPSSNVVALWDIQFDYTITNDMLSSLGSIVHSNNEFWVGEWNSSNIARLDNDGNVLETFSIPSIFGIRAMTWDGTSIWMSNNTQSIFEINPVTKMIVNTVEIPFLENVRFLTYDETADSGNGGFWVGNFSTDIALFSKMGTLLLTIPITTHTLNDIYGAVVDKESEGGPYLWAFQQAGGNLNALVTQLKLPEGTPTGVARDVQIDLETVDNLAGGLFLTDTWGTGLTLGGILQVTEDFDRLFGYELSFGTSDNADIKMSEIVVPNSDCELTTAEALSVLIENKGAVVTFDMPLNFYQNELLIVTEIVPDTIEAGESLLYTFNYELDLSEIDFYNLEVIAAATGDVNNSNDRVKKTISNRPIITLLLEASFENLPLDTTIFSNLYNISDLPFRVNTGGTVSLGTGPANDSSGGMGQYIYMESSDGAVGSQAILRTTCLDLTSFSNPELTFAYHAYGDGIGFLSVDVLDELGSLHNLFLIEGQQQMASEDAWNFESFDLSDFDGQQIEIIFTGEIDSTGQSFNADIALDEISIDEIVAVDEISVKKGFSIFPNPATDKLFIKMELSELKMVNFQLLNHFGQTILNVKKEAILNENIEMDIANFPVGIYFLKIEIEGEIITQKVFIR